MVGSWRLRRPPRRRGEIGTFAAPPANRHDPRGRAHALGCRLQRRDRTADHGLGLVGGLGLERAHAWRGAGWARIEFIGELLDQVLDQFDAHLGLRLGLRCRCFGRPRIGPAEGRPHGVGDRVVERRRLRRAEIEWVVGARIRAGPTARPPTPVAAASGAAGIAEAVHAGRPTPRRPRSSGGRRRGFGLDDRTAQQQMHGEQDRIDGECEHQARPERQP